MNLNQSDHPEHIINSKKYWFLRQMTFVDDCLVLIISEGKISSQAEMIHASEGVELGPVRRIAPDATSLHFRIEFESPISFQRTDESYPWARGVESGTAGTIAETKQLPSHIVDKTLHHYQVDCMDDLIDVITAKHPKMISISNSDFDSRSLDCVNYLRVDE